MTATRRQAWGKYDSMNKDGPNGSPYETLAKHDQSETKHDMLISDLSALSGSYGLRDYGP
jgi:hypothetical protein